MKRFLACALVALIGNASSAFAGESLLAAGSRQVQLMAAAPAATTAATAMKSASGVPAVQPAAAPAYQEGGGPGNLSKSGHSKMTKTMIYAALGVGFGLAAWQIDRHVLNITPSSLGQRKD